MDLKIFENILPVIISIIGSSYFTYLLSNHNKKTKNYEDLLNFIYLPIAKVNIFPIEDYTTNINTLKIYLISIQPIIENNLQYVSDFLLNQYLSLKAYIISNDYDNAKKTYNIILKYTNNEFDSIKRRMGLPNKGFYYLFSSMKRNEKILLFPAFILVIFISLFIIEKLYKLLYVIYLLINSVSTINIEWEIFFPIAFLLTIYIFIKCIEHFKKN